MNIENFKMSFRDEILELAKMGVIKIEDNGEIKTTAFGWKVMEELNKNEN